MVHQHQPVKDTAVLDNTFHISIKLHSIEITPPTEGNTNLTINAVEFATAVFKGGIQSFIDAFEGLEDKAYPRTHYQFVVGRAIQKANSIHPGTRIKPNPPTKMPDKS